MRMQPFTLTANFIQCAQATAVAELARFYPLCLPIARMQAGVCTPRRPSPFACLLSSRRPLPAGDFMPCVFDAVSCRAVHLAERRTGQQGLGVPGLEGRCLERAAAAMAPLRPPPRRLWPYGAAPDRCQSVADPWMSRASASSDPRRLGAARLIWPGWRASRSSGSA